MGAAGLAAGASGYGGGAFASTWRLPPEGALARDPTDADLGNLVRGGLGGGGGSGEAFFFGGGGDIPGGGSVEEEDDDGDEEEEEEKEKGYEDGDGEGGGSEKSASFSESGLSTGGEGGSSRLTRTPSWARFWKKAPP